MTRAASIVGLVAFAAAMGSAHAGDEAPQPCRAELIAETATLRPGTEATLGVRFVLAEGWHVYWKNPGESGLAPTVAWTLPAGFEAGPLQWPAPHRVTSDGIVGYVYEGDVVLPVTLKVPASAKTGDVTISARVGWLVCRDVCEPGEATVELKIAVKDAAPAADPSAAAAFASARERLPRPLPPGAARIDSTADRVTLSVEAPEVADEDVRSVEFFPAEQLVLDDPVAEVLEKKDLGKLRVRLNPAPRRKELVNRLQGVLVVKTAKRAVAYDIDAAATDPKNPGSAGDKSPR